MAIAAYDSHGTGAIGERGTSDFVIDSAEDVSLLPTDLRVVAPGSTAIDSAGHVYVLFPSGTWSQM